MLGELANGVGDPAPHGLAAVIVLRGELVAARSAFLKGLVAVALEHEVGGAPDVDLGYQERSLPPADGRSRRNVAARMSILSRETEDVSNLLVRKEASYH